MSNLVFLDASFWVAYREDGGAWQPEARRALYELFRQRTQFVTTLPVLCEIHAAFSRNRRVRGEVLRELFHNPLVAIEEISNQDQKLALGLLQSSQDKTYSLCDALSFVIMRRLNIRRAATFDKHFRQFGEFDIIPENFP